MMSVFVVMLNDGYDADVGGHGAALAIMMVIVMLITEMNRCALFKCFHGILRVLSGFLQIPWDSSQTLSRLSSDRTSLIRKKTERMMTRMPRARRHYFIGWLPRSC